MMTAAVEKIQASPYKENINGAYMAGYMAALNEERGKRRAERQKRERKKYFVTQKVTGVVVLVFTAAAVKVLDGDATIAFLTIPLGLSLLLSKEMLIVNRYYWKCEEENGELPQRE